MLLINILYFFIFIYSSLHHCYTDMPNILVILLASLGIKLSKLKKVFKVIYGRNSVYILL